MKDKITVDKEMWVQTCISHTAEKHRSQAWKKIAERLYQASTCDCCYDDGENCVRCVKAFKAFNALKRSEAKIHPDQKGGL